MLNGVTSATALFKVWVTNAKKIFCAQILYQLLNLESRLIVIDVSFFFTSLLSVMLMHFKAILLVFYVVQNT